MRLLALFALASLPACSTPAPLDAGLDAPLDVPVAPADTGRPDHPYVDPFVCTGAPAALPLDEALDGTHARAGVITQPREVIGGEGAYSRVGHFKLYNDRVRFVVQGATSPTGPMRPAGYDLYGGNVIDADRVRPAGERDRDVFREMFPLA
ncbi:MAG: hypothetical protein WCJ30_21635, partial [Deltaproteobacteria bacterium]